MSNTVFFFKKFRSSTLGVLVVKLVYIAH
ncbi:hypothetical protein AT5G03885 [Arabidopsis thaliana]|uniref:Uncharacterized protein n=1 Tax=Arabidopsis thaliana TaxID=3702 RepID=A0A1P8BH36_ARATH|nr:uncharacterized protein AT5G03885 [Arabidopsis thaliana]ANM70904.1 hypothetical protein AT5G03885 [Arabidopsis thaliana]|eukprot:NP_001332478.1 hypothetical protein AT5G03885 [Arabidopsis thaliana]